MNIIRTLYYPEYLKRLDEANMPYPAYLRPYIEEVFTALSSKELTAQGVAKIILYAVYRVDTRGMSMMAQISEIIPQLIREIIIPDDLQAQEKAIEYIKLYAESVQKVMEFAKTEQWAVVKELFDVVFELWQPVIEATDDPMEAWLEQMACNAVTEVARWREHRKILATLRS